MRATFFDPTLQEQLEADGYVTLPLLSDEEVDALRASFNALGPAPGDPEMACHSSFHTYDPEYKRKAHDSVMKVLGPHLTRVVDRQRALPSNFIVKWPSGMSGFGLHQDLSLVDERLHRSVEVWVALDDTNETNGQLWFVPGSHSWVPTLRGIHAFPSPFASVAKRLVQHHALPVPVKRGDAIVFNHAVVHFSLPNRSASPRMVAIADLIPEEADHLHYFGDGKGLVEAYHIDDSFWIENSPFTLWRPPPRARCIGPVNFDFREILDSDLDRLVNEGRAIESSISPRGAINAGRAWCHRCGTTEFESDPPDRMMGNVTMLCPTCQRAELQHAATPAHSGV